MSKDLFTEDRYETPDRETVLEAENKRLKARIEELEKASKGDFVQGYVCAVATYIRMNENDTVARELLYAGCATLKQAKDAGVDEYDLDPCKPTWKEIASRIARKLKP